jgi:hypothetical protein
MQLTQITEVKESDCEREKAQKGTEADVNINVSVDPGTATTSIVMSAVCGTMVIPRHGTVTWWRNRGANEGWFSSVS